jgi:hypothetical protein
VAATVASADCQDVASAIAGHPVGLSRGLRVVFHI